MTVWLFYRSFAGESGVPRTRVDGNKNPDAHRRAIRRGAMGIVLKDHAADQLLKAIMKVTKAKSGSNGR